MNEWKKDRIGNHILPTKTRNPTINPESEFTYIDVSSIDNNLFKITTPSLLYGRDAPSRARKIVQKDDVIFATVRPTLRRIAYITEQFHNQICNTGFCVLKVKETLNSKFLYYWLLSDFILRDVEKIQRGASYPAIRDSDLKNLQIPIPPLEEQEKIAWVLSMVQDAIAQQEQLITLTTELKKALMHKLFSEGTLSETQKNTEMSFPKSWNVKALGELASKPHGCLQTGPFGSQLHKDEYQTEGTLVINPTHLAGNKINPEDVPRISLQTASRLNRHYLEVGDILFARWGEIGRHGLVGEKENGWLCGTGCFLVRVKQKFIDNRFLSYYFSTNHLINWLYKHAAGAIMPNLNNAVMRKMPIYFPDIAIQQQIADNLDSIGYRISNLQEKHTLLNDLFRTLLHQLMTAQIRVDDLNLSALHLEPQGGEE